MFECNDLSAASPTPLSSADLARAVDRLVVVDTASTDAELMNQITQLERMKSACAAAQAALTEALVTSRKAGLTNKEIKDERVHRSIAAEVALARRDSPVRGGRHVGLATALVHEMPNTYAALQRGEISEWRATLLVRETACLTLSDRRSVDAELAGTLSKMGDGQTAAAARRLAQKLDPAAWVERHRKATSERRVSIRPAPDTMGYVSALLPVAKAVAVWAALSKHADTARAAGDERSRGQVMADEFITRVTQPHAEPQLADTPAPAGSNGGDGYGDVSSVASVTPSSGAPGGSANSAGADAGSPAEDGRAPDDEPELSSPVPRGANLDIQLIMTDRTLFERDDEPAHMVGYGPIPAPLARHLVRDAGRDIKAWIRRLYTDPDTGHVVTADSRRRTFSHAARQLLIARDQVCRTPWCDAPIRHADHVTPYAAGGSTTISNGRGTCESCNYVKEAAGWSASADPGGHTVTITTPTGHTFESTPPPPPRSAPWRKVGPLEARLRQLLREAAA